MNVWFILTIMYLQVKMAVPPSWHFRGWHNSIGLILQEEGILEETSQEFSKLKSNLDRIKFLWKIKCVHRTLKMSPNYTAKSEQKAVKMRNAGNTAYSQKNYRSAFDLYNAAICFSPWNGSDTLALSFANRSAVCFQENNYFQCLKDIQSALDRKYPEKLCHKLYERQGKCYSHLGESLRARESFEKAKTFLKFAKLDDEKLKQLTSDIDAHLEKIVLNDKNKAADITEECSISRLNLNASIEKTYGPVPTHTEGNHKIFLSLASYCDVAYEPDIGRHIVAKRDIRPGETILIEKPYASVSMADYIKSHCHHCYTRLHAMYPCKHCASAIFCSPKCAVIAWDAYHKFECEYLDFVRQSRINVFGTLALRAVTRTPIEKIVELMDKIKKVPYEEPDLRLAGCDKDGIYRPGDYDTMLNLVGHTEKRTMEDLFKRSLQAVMLLKVLAESDYFDAAKASDTHNMKMFVGSLLLHHLQSFPCNAHEIPEMQLDKKSVSTSEAIELGAGIYATLSLFNHSCNPTVNRNFYGDVCVVRAIRPIKQGQEITDNYGAVNAIHSKEIRIEKMRYQYFFDCKCEACENDWPLYHGIQDDFAMWKCTNCHSKLGVNPGVKAKCKSCGTVHDIKEYKRILAVSMTTYLDAMQKLLDDGSIEDTLPVFLERLELLEKYLQQPFRPFNDCQEAVKQCFSIMGNCYHIKN